MARVSAGRARLGAGSTTVWECGDVPDHFRGIAPLAIVIMGVSGSGKSTLGAEIAHTIGCPFLEGDSFHASEAIAKMRAGTPLTDGDRCPWLDRIGRAVETEINRHGIAVAACSALRKVYRDRLRDAITAPVRFVLLDVDREELTQRLNSRAGHYMPASLLSSQLETLERPEPDETVLTLDARLPPTLLAEQALAWLKGQTKSEAQSPSA